MERQESRSDQIGKEIAKAIHYSWWLVPSVLTLGTLGRMLEDRPLGEKVVTVGLATFSWGASAVICRMIEIQQSEDEVNYVDDTDLR